MKNHVERIRYIADQWLSDLALDSASAALRDDGEGARTSRPDAASVIEAIRKLADDALGHYVTHHNAFLATCACGRSIARGIDETREEFMARVSSHVAGAPSCNASTANPK